VSRPEELRIPLGYSFAGMACGIKVKRRDLALLLSHAPASVAGRLTTSLTRAASVRRNALWLPAAEVRAIVVASGNANAMTGPGDDADELSVVEAIAASLDLPSEAVLSAATGVIGVPFPVEKVRLASKRLVELLGTDPVPAAEAILTTDTTTKLASREVFVHGTRVRILGIGKGSGMVHPELATVLGFILTDAAVSPAALDRMLGLAVDDSFQMLSIDGESSTNDQVLAFANGASGADLIDDPDSEAARTLGTALAEVARELARQVARDGEGARKLVTVRVERAGDTSAARSLARAVASSTLVKCALFGADPGYGRVLAALGSQAARERLELDPRRISITMQGTAVFTSGAPTPFEHDALRAKLRHDEVALSIDLDLREGSATAYGCDLSYDYVRINADYAAVLVESPGGPVYRDQRLETKTPELKKEVLVSALRYIERFRGTRAVVRFGPSTLARLDLTTRLAEDVRLLAAVGLRPILVQAGPPSELMVSSLARQGVRAVGLTPADGNLLRRGPARRSNTGSRPPPPPAGDAGFVVDPEIIELLLAKEYVPVVMPEDTSGLADSVAPDDEAQGALGIDVDTVASEIAIACSAHKLIYLVGRAGLVVRAVEGAAGFGESEGDAAKRGEATMLLSEVSAEELAARLEEGSIDPSLVPQARGAVRALAGGVETVHLIDERVPHHVVAELFTETGVGTMVR
jgi:acetylglutamate kinase